jgi:hypothetical protein
MWKTAKPLSPIGTSIPSDSMPDYAVIPSIPVAVKDGRSDGATVISSTEAAMNLSRILRADAKTHIGRMFGR